MARWIPLLFLAACGGGGSSAEDAPVQPIDAPAIDGAIDGSIDAAVAKFPVRCDGTVSNRTGPDKFGGEALSAVVPYYSYDPTIPDEEPATGTFSASNLAQPAVNLVVFVQGSVTRWRFEMVATSRCDLVVLNNNPDDEWFFDCSGLKATPAIANETSFRFKMLAKQSDGLFSSDSLPDGPFQAATADFQLIGAAWQMNGGYGSCRSESLN